MFKLSKIILIFGVIMLVGPGSFYAGYYLGKNRYSDSVAAQVRYNTTLEIEKKLKDFSPSDLPAGVLKGTVKSISSDKIVLARDPQDYSDLLWAREMERAYKITADTKIFYQTMKKQMDADKSGEIMNNFALKFSDINTGDTVYMLVDESGLIAKEIKVIR